MKPITLDSQNLVLSNIGGINVIKIKNILRIFSEKFNQCFSGPSIPSAEELRLLNHDKVLSYRA